MHEQQRKSRLFSAQYLNLNKPILSIFNIIGLRVTFSILFCFQNCFSKICKMFCLMINKEVMILDKDPCILEVYNGFFRAKYN